MAVMLQHPQMPLYDGTTNPCAFLNRYEWQMDSSRGNDPAKCKCFLVFLFGTALLWFSRLPLDSINNFRQLAIELIKQFRVHIPTPKNALTLSNLYQGPAESLRNYLSRFNTSLTEVEDLDPRATLFKVSKGRSLYFRIRGTDRSETAKKPQRFPREG